MSDKHRFLEELGNTQTVKDVQAAYNQLVENRRLLAVQRKHARQEEEKRQAEIETFLDDMEQLTGLPRDSPLFNKLVFMTLAKRMQRRNLAAQRAIAQDEFPNGW